MKNPEDDLWAVEDAAEAAGITRQWLNELLRQGMFECVEVRNRQNPEVLRPRARLMRTKEVKRLIRYREKEEKLQAEREARARVKRRER